MSRIRLFEEGRIEDLSRVDSDEPGIPPTEYGAPTEASLASWLPLTTIFDRPNSSRGLNAYLRAHFHGAVPERGL